MVKLKQVWGFFSSLLGEEEKKTANSTSRQVWLKLSHTCRIFIFPLLLGDSSFSSAWIVLILCIFLNFTESTLNLWHLVLTLGSIKTGSWFIYFFIFLNSVSEPWSEKHKCSLKRSETLKSWHFFPPLAGRAFFLCFNETTTSSAGSRGWLVCYFCWK